MMPLLAPGTVTALIYKILQLERLTILRIS
jgi:hypothetical protein